MDDGARVALRVSLFNPDSVKEKASSAARGAHCLVQALLLRGRRVIVSDRSHARWCFADPPIRVWRRGPLRRACCARAWCVLMVQSDVGYATQVSTKPFFIWSSSCGAKGAAREPEAGGSARAAGATHQEGLVALVDLASLRSGRAPMLSAGRGAARAGDPSQASVFAPPPCRRRTSRRPRGTSTAGRCQPPARRRGVA